MKILTNWLRSYLPVLDVSDAQLAEDLTLRGIAVEGVFELNDGAGKSDGALFDMDITTNRVDAMNHYGIAREVAAIYGLPLYTLDASLPAAPERVPPFPVRIEEPGLCGRFSAQVIRAVTIGPSAGTTSHYFGKLGQKQISNAVDATNFVLLGMGQPTHAFDLDKISGGIVVRKAKAGEEIKLLDGSTRTLSADDLVVADEEKALGLAGVMGGWDSMITAETKNVLVEAAWFDPATVRASSRRHLIHTDASHRFERGADFAAAPVANSLVTKAILAACGGSLEGGLVDVVVPEHEAATSGRGGIKLSVERVQRLLGETLAPEGIRAELVVRFLSALGCKLTHVDTDTYEARLPSWRLDLSREIDLIEEVARVYGYNRFANTLPVPAEVIPYPTARAESAVRARLFQLGFSEAISSTFASAVDSASFAPETGAVALANPLNEEAAHLRPSLLPGMIGMLAQNLSRDVSTVRLFETGTVFAGANAEVQEQTSLSLGLTGESQATALHSAQDAPFFELKGAVGSSLRLFAIDNAVYSTERVPTVYEAGRGAVVLVNGSALCSFGQLASSEAARWKLRQPVYLAEIKLQDLLAFPLRQTSAHEISRFQPVERDFSFTFPETTTWLTISAAVDELGIAELQKLTAEEIFRDAERMAGKFSVLVRVMFQSAERTLVEAELAGWSSAIIASLEHLGGVLRT